MKKIGKLLKDKRWRWTAGGVMCLVVASMIFALGADNQAAAANSMDELNNANGSITTAAEFELLRNATATETAKKTYTLQNDITISEISSAAKGSFAGTFNGNGHVITIKKVNITNNTGGSQEQIDGLLFGTVGGTIQNVIIDITDDDEEADYVRTTKVAVKKQTPKYEYEESKPLITGTVSGLDSDPSAANTMHVLNTPGNQFESGSNSYIKQSVIETGTETIQYVADKVGNDGFGILCGTLTDTGTIRQVSLNGETLGIQRNVETTQEWSQSVQKGTRQKYYYYKIGKETKETGLAASDENKLSVSSTAYAGNKTVTGSSDALGKVLEVNVSAPTRKEITEGTSCSIIYKVTVSNPGEKAISDVKLYSSKSGVWEDQTADSETISIGTISANGNITQKFVYTYENSESVSAEVNMSFWASAAAVPNEEIWNVETAKASVKTEIYNEIQEPDSETATDQQYNETIAADALKLEVTAPQAVEKSSKTEISYTIKVTNNTDKILSGLKWSSSLGDDGWSSKLPSALAAKSSRTVTYTYKVAEGDTKVENTNFSVTANVPMNGDTEDYPLSVQTSGITTVVYDAVGFYDEKTFSDIGLYAKLEVDKQGIIAGNGNLVTYKLTLMNQNTVPTDTALLSKNILINTELTEWKVENGEKFNVNSNKRIPAGAAVILSKTVMPNIAEESSKTETEEIVLSGTLTEYAETYTLTEAENIGNNAVSAGAFTKDASTAETGGSPIKAGNRLYAGGLVGKTAGDISMIKQTAGLKGTENENEFLIGGIAGYAESGILSNLYMIGEVNDQYVGTGSITLSTSARTEEEALTLADSGTGNAWDIVEKYSADGTKQKFGDLAWLVKESTFNTGAVNGGKIQITVASSDLLSDRTLAYTIAYNARKSMSETSENNVYVSADENMELGQSGYYRVLNSYATDGYYHYCSDIKKISGTAEAVIIYPYKDEFSGYQVKSGDIVRSSTNPLEDEVKIELNENDSGTAYFSYRSSDLIGSIPTDSDESVVITDGVINLPFEMNSVSYRIVPIVDGHIYPAISTTTFDESNKEPVPKPNITVFDYYDKDGNENTYQALGQGAYEVGTDMKIEPNAEGETESYSFRYLYSTNVPKENEWKTAADVSEECYSNRYIGEDTSFMNNAAVYEASAEIPEDMAANKAYLYVEISKKNYPSQIYYYGPFSVIEKRTIIPNVTSNGSTVSGYGVLDGDILKLSVNGAPEGSRIEYIISTKEMSAFSSWNEYTSSGITMRQDAGGFVYARIKYGEDKYGEVQSFEYTFGGTCAEPRVTPNTGLSSGGEAAAAVIEATTGVTLSSRTTDAEIFYLISDSSQQISMERASSVPEDVTEDGQISGEYKYFKVESRWYRTAFTEVQRYNRDLNLNHEEPEAQLKYISAIAVAEGYEPSGNVEYVYKVQPAKQTANPEAAYETRFTPGGESVEIANVSLGSKITFLSITPGAKLYYAIGSGSEIPNTEIPSEGIEVEGNYGDSFVVRVMAKKDGMLDSDVITFVYVVSDQELTSAPTATPGTSADVPTTVIPGNKILLSSTTKEARIFYTTDGSSPQINENEDGTFTPANEVTFLYETSGIEMPLQGKDYFTITAVAVKQGLAKSAEAHFTYNYPGAVLAPYANLNSGKVEMNAEVILKNLTEDAVIYYTIAYGETLPEEPILSSAVFSEEYPVKITQKTTIMAMAVKDAVKSSIVTFTFDPMAQLDAPQASVASGSVVASGTLLELKAASGATVYYTMDGSDPTDNTNTAVMSGNSLTLNGSAGDLITIKAYAKAADKSQSEVVTFTYQFSQNAGGVTASIENGSLVSNGMKVNLMSDVSDAKIYYTTDGSSPIEDGKEGTTVEIDGTPGGSFTIKAVAVVNGEPGTIATFIYKIKERPIAPTASPSGGTLTVATRVTLDSNAEKIYYTTDGNDPTKSSAPYSEPILINRTTTLKAIAVSEDGEVSEIATYYYVAAEKAAEVISSKVDGSILNPGDEVKLSTSTEGAVIYYSTDGTEPTVDNFDSMLIYNGESIEVNRSVTIHAVAYKDGLRLSDVKVLNFIVDVIPAVEQKKAEAEKLAEEGLKDTDISELARQNEKDKELLLRTVREKEYNTSVSYKTDVLPATITLETTKEETNSYTVKKTKGFFGGDTTVLETYKLKVKSGGINKQPTEEVEVAFKIPKGYEDAALTVAMVDSDYNLITLETRREAEVLYAKTEKFGSYVIIGPERKSFGENTFPYILLLEIAAGMTLFVGIVYYTKEKIKKYRKEK